MIIGCFLARHVSKNKCPLTVSHSRNTATKIFKYNITIEPWQNHCPLFVVYDEWHIYTCTYVTNVWLKVVKCERNRNKFRTVNHLKQSDWANCSVMLTLRTCVHCVYSTSLILKTHAHYFHIMHISAQPSNSELVFFLLLSLFSYFVLFIDFHWWLN